MALITCPECGREISDCASVCPYCGKPMNQYYLDDTKPKRGGHGCLWAVVILVLVVGFMAVTCPDKEKHRERMSSEISATIMSEMKEGEKNMFTQLLVSTVAVPLVDRVLDEMLVVDSYGIVSVGRLKNIDDGEDRIVSVGMANYVFSAVNEENIKKFVQEVVN